MKRKWLAGILAMTLAIAMTACGSSSSSSSSSEDSSEDSGDTESTESTESEETESVELTTDYTVSNLEVKIWDNNQLAGLQQIADEWTETSGVTVNIEVVDWDNYWTLLEAGASGGDMPDVFWMHSNTAQIYMENDLLLDLDPYIEADDSINLDNYYEGVVDLYTRSDGVHYAIPKDHDTIALLYNTAIFDEYGVEYPTDDWTWEDMYEAAAAITEASGGDVYGLAMDTSNNQDGWYNLVYGYGGTIITDDHTDTTLDSDEAKAGMEMVRQLLTVATPQSVVSETGTDTLFISGKAAMITQGSWMILEYYQAENAADYAWAMLPYADLNENGECDEGERVSCYNGLGWAASAATEDPNAAYSLISYFCSEEAQIEQAELGVTMGGMTGVSDYFANAFEGMDITPFITIEEEGSLFFRPYTRNTTVWEDAIQQSGAFLDAWLDPSDADLMSTACDNAAAIIRDAIADE